MAPHEPVGLAGQRIMPAESTAPTRVAFPEPHSFAHVLAENSPTQCESGFPTVKVTSQSAEVPRR
jgi:hypothetical protein